MIKKNDIMECSMTLFFTISFTLRNWQYVEDDNSNSSGCVCRKREET